MKRNASLYLIWGIVVVLIVLGSSTYAADFPICTATDDQKYPKVAYDGTNHLVIWQDYRSDSWDIYGQRVSTSGGLVGSNINICAATGFSPALAWSGVNYLVVWYQGGTWNKNVWGQRVNSAGQLLGTNFAITSGEVYDEFQYPNIVWGDTNYLVVFVRYTDYQYIYGRKVNSSGSLVGDTFAICTTPSDDMWSHLNPAVAWDGTNYLVVWDDYRSASNYDIYGQIVNSAGGLVGSNFPICTAANDQRRPDIVWDGTNYLVVWYDRRNGNWDIYGQRINTSGGLVGSNIPISTDGSSQYYPAVAWSGNQYLVVWRDYRGDYYDIYGQRLDATGGLFGTNFVVSTAATDQDYPDLAWDGSHYLVVWHQDVSGYYDIYGNIDLIIGIVEKLTAKAIGQEARLIVYPNPFTRSTVISYQLPVDEKVSLGIYDLTGRLVKNFLNEEISAGYYTVTWNGKDDSGQRLAPGIYFSCLQAGGFRNTKKMILLK